MINFRRNILTYVCSLGAVFMISACSGEKGGNESANFRSILDNDSIPQVIKNIVTAVYDNDPAMFAKEVSYPLLRPYPLKDIQNEDEMKAYYDVVVDDSLRNVILSSNPEDWQEYGWRGYSLKDGSYMWVDGSIYDISYVSEKEKALQDSLLTVERNSLPEQIRNGWQPLLTLCSNEDGKVYRIDRSLSSQKGSPMYRLSVYSNHGNGIELLKMPDEILDGYMQTEGTASVESYIFHGKGGENFVIYPDDPGSGTPVLTLPDGRESELTKGYWYELIK